MTLDEDSIRKYTILKICANDIPKSISPLAAITFHQDSLPPQSGQA
jgi:hypothetical protein